MDRRTLLKGIPACAACVAGGTLLVRKYGGVEDSPTVEKRFGQFDPLRDEGAIVRIAPNLTSDKDLDSERLQKIKEFDRSYEDDFQLSDAEFELLRSTSDRFGRAQDLVGHGNYNLLSFEQLLTFARNYPRIGGFDKAELDFLEELFYADAARYGFYGDKVIGDLSERIRDRDVVKIAGSGHYLLKGDSLERFTQIRRDIGDTITLTSGVRSTVKQYQLFLRKAVETEGNLSQASRSLAPPGYSYHARGDFDIGKVGFGLENFTESFSETDEFKKLLDLGYISIRYTETNPFGVRHEPWHIKIA